MTAAGRRRAVVEAGHRGDATVARQGLGDEDPAVRAAALGALERCGALDDDDLRRALRDPAPGVRRRALHLAARRPAVPVRALLDDPDPAVVEVAAWACGEQEDAAAVARLAALATGHDDALVREAAVAALGAIGDEAGLPAILAATRDRATVRRRAVLALAPFAGPEVDEAIARARTDRDWQVRQAAEDVGGTP